MSREENQNNIIDDLYKGELIEGILEMARVGFLPVGQNKSPVEVYVNTDDPGKIPHFHIRKKSGKGNNSFEWDLCIKYKEAEYFEHGRHKGKLPNKKYVDMLIKMFKSIKRDDKSYWEYAVDMWNDNNSDIILPDDLPMPDYTKLKVGK